MAQLEAAAGRTAVVGQLLVGMGGVGKSQLAARYARDVYEAGRVDVLLWVTAVSPEAVTDAYAHAAAQILGADSTDPQAAWRFRNWLELPPGERQGGPVAGARWLVVLDDVPDTSAVAGLWPPDVPHGRTVVTTRNQDASLLSGRARVDVGLFSREQAVAYLTEKLARSGRVDEAGEVAGLAEDLGRLPLALAQVVPFMLNKGLDCAGYRRRLADRARTLTDVLPPQGGLPDQHSRTVAAAWDLSIELADEQSPKGLARPLLHLLSLLDPNGIPAPVLTGGPVQTHLAAHRPATSTSP
ncbi:NB-ARC domain-containing protein, partial [Streptomyces sp. 7-21]|uniref:NB-ARC domain-containing protein n=1 Tax=Streptomyces sp. 7-21 TaxID=2802283 RepID=UPI001A527E9E